MSLLIFCVKPLLCVFGSGNTSSVSSSGGTGLFTLPLPLPLLLLLLGAEQAFGQLPPQSVPVSSPFCMLSEQLAPDVSRNLT